MDSNGMPLLPHSELAFRAPLSKVNSPGSSNSNMLLFPVLSRMYIASDILRFQPETRFSALVFLHRYAITIDEERIQRHRSISDWKWIAAVCLFLACKAEEEPRRLRDVINLVKMLFICEGNGNTVTMKEHPPNLNEDYWKAKAKIIETEQIVLRWLGFDLYVSHPHRAVYLLLEKEKVRDDILPIAFRRLNDALFHAAALNHSVLELACASIELAEEELKLETKIASTRDWCSNYNIQKDGIVKAKARLIEVTSSLEVCMKKSEFCVFPL